MISETEATGGHQQPHCLGHKLDEDGRAAKQSLRPDGGVGVYASAEQNFGER